VRSKEIHREKGGVEEKGGIIRFPLTSRIMKREPDAFQLNGQKLRSSDPLDVADALVFFCEIGKIGNPKSVKKACRYLPTIRRIFKKSEDEEIRIKALQTLAALHDYQTVGLVKKLLEKVPRGTRLADTLAWFLGEIARDIQERVLPEFYTK
jgi:hypothetical protein